MAKPIRGKDVNLSDVIDALELMPDEWSAYVNRRTGEVVSLSTDAFDAIDKEDSDEEYFGEADETMIALAREIQNSKDFEKLPNKFELNEWSIMREFCLTVEDDGYRTELLEAIQGRGAFRFFKSTLVRLGLRDQWFQFRNETLEFIAINWLKVHDIPWKRTDSADSATPD